MMGPAKTKPVTLNDGSVLAASADLSDKGWKISFEKTEDRGRTFTRSSTHFSRLSQPTIFKSSSGMGMIAHSTDETLYVAKADEDAAHWEPAKKTNLENAHSAIDSVVLADGRLLLAYNPVTE
ncbi:uncharacterized protein LOC142355288, partial [Convolutriloba macropyga]|uniref:uncharacterized protein LOC142355288 n=1 Tax=Convolutriloba macropyga TaxID=536237 RepID=UPI003F51B139